MVQGAKFELEDDFGVIDVAADSVVVDALAEVVVAGVFHSVQVVPPVVCLVPLYATPEIIV